MSREAMKLALEFLSHDMVAEDWPHQKRKDAVCDALRAALAEPQTTHWEGCEAVHPECKAKPITTAEMSAWVKDTWEKCQTEAWQESVTCMCREPWALERVHREKTPCFDYVERKPLTDEEMRECAQAMNAEPLAEGWPELIKFARAIERAHGITGEQHE